MQLAEIRESTCNEKECPTCRSKIYEWRYCEMYAGSYVSNGIRLEIRRVPREGFKDPIYLDELTQYFEGGLYRIWPGDPYLSKGGKRLHRQVWRDAFGE